MFMSPTSTRIQQMLGKLFNLCGKKAGRTLFLDAVKINLAGCGKIELSGQFLSRFALFVSYEWVFAWVPVLPKARTGRCRAV